MRIVVCSLFIILLFTSFKPGVGTVMLTCSSESGRTVFEAEFEEYDILQRAKLKVDNAILPFYNSDHTSVIFDAESKVYTLNIESETPGQRYLQLWAIPSSFKKEESQESGIRDVYKFTAKMKATEPREGKDFDTPLILLNCKMTYSTP